MNPSHAYKEQQALGWTRIDMLLALYGGAIDRLEQALVSLERGESDLTRTLLLRAQLMVTELLSGIDLQYGALPTQLARLYDFALWAINQGTPRHIRSAISVLKTLREGLEGIRDQAISLERRGQVPPVGTGTALSRAV